VIEKLRTKEATQWLGEESWRHKELKVHEIHLTPGLTCPICKGDLNGHGAYINFGKLSLVCPKAWLIYTNDGIWNLKEASFHELFKPVEPVESVESSEPVEV
jgi:hypothetical protein